jgi:hypothetical protein
MRGFVKAANKANPTRDFVVAACGRPMFIPVAVSSREYSVENRQRLDFVHQLPEHVKHWEHTVKILQPTTTVLKSVWKFTL